MKELILFFGHDQMDLIDITIKACRDVIKTHKKRKLKKGVRYTITFNTIYGAYIFGHTQGSILMKKNGVFI